MKVIYSETLRHSDDLFALAQRASQILEKVATHSSSLATAEWDADTDKRGQTSFVLRLSDWVGSVAEDFSLAELTDTEGLLGRLNKLWGDLLEIRSHRLLDELNKSLSDAGV